MREQFFLDARDYIKFSLLEDLANGPPKRSLTLIWMLTPDKGNGHGQRRPRFDPSRLRLNEFFTQASRPRLGMVRSYFEAGGISCASYGESAKGYFEAKDRASYFSNVPSSALSNAVVFLDPDNGLEPLKSCTTAHVAYGEVAELFGRMDETSVLVIYQHLPRRTASVFWPEIATRLEAATLTAPFWVEFGDLAFYLLPKNPIQLLSIPRIEEHYQLHTRSAS